MPYKLSAKGKELTEAYSSNYNDYLEAQMTLTPLMFQALSFLRQHPDRYYISSEIARFYKLAPQAMRGPTAQLYRLGLLNKQDEFVFKRNQDREARVANKQRITQLKRSGVW